MVKEKVLIADDNEVIELKGDKLKEFELMREQMRQEMSLIEAEQTKKKEARQNAIKKLAEIAGLTDEEINSII